MRGSERGAVTERFEGLNRQDEKGAKMLLGIALFVGAHGCMPKCKEPVCPSCAPAPAPAGVVMTPDGSLPAITWTDEELAKDVALRTVRQTDAASYHVVRLLRAEKPHAHDRSDLTVFVLSGAVNMHLGTRVIPVGPGQVIDIPKGVPHWAENTSADPSFAFVVFAPAFDGKDRRPVDDPASAGSGPH